MGEYRKVEQFHQLPRGTIVRHVSGGRSYVVTSNYGNRVTAVDNVDITHLSEWLWFDETSTQGKPGDSNGR